MVLLLLTINAFTISEMPI